MKSKVKLSTGSVYHIFNKSIEGFRIFNHAGDFERMIALMRYYKQKKNTKSYSLFSRSKQQSEVIKKPSFFDSQDNLLVSIVAFCLMPTHYHLILQQTCDDGILHYMQRVQNGYSKYFNAKAERKGPLWMGRFGRVLVETDEQLLHLTRYVHLNAVAAFIVNAPEDWKYSSYNEYVKEGNMNQKITQYEQLISMSSEQYVKFCKNRISEQRQRSILRKLLD